MQVIDLVPARQYDLLPPSILVFVTYSVFGKRLVVCEKNTRVGTLNYLYQLSVNNFVYLHARRAECEEVWIS